DAEEIEILVDVPETVMVTDLDTADIVELVAELSGAPGIQFPVDIREISQVADPTTQTFTIRAAMQAPEGIRVLPGMTATATATYRRANVLGQRIMVPISAVSQQPDGESVAWVLGADQNLSRRSVKLGSAAGGSVEIIEGLEPGERIAVA